MGGSGKWDACLVATIHQLETALGNHGPDCLSHSTLLALCCVLASRHTCTMWLMSLLGRPGASGTKGTEFLPTLVDAFVCISMLRLYASLVLLLFKIDS